MIQLDKIEFFKFLNFDIDISEFEKIICRHPNWEESLGEDLYFEMINFDFKDKNSSVRMREFLLSKIVEVAEFETWKLKNLLQRFLIDVQKMPQYLETFYELYCGKYQENQARKFSYKFLGNLGLNFFFWKDEHELKQHYGENWKLEHDKILNDLEFYHKQLRPIAAEILLGLERGDIHILNYGVYHIEGNLKERLETNKVFQLVHPRQLNGS